MAGEQGVERRTAGCAVDDRADEPLRDRLARAGEDLDHRALLDDPAVLHDRDLVGELAHHVHLVRDDDDRDAELGVDLAQQGQHLLRRVRVEGARGLVGEQDLRLRRERAGDADALLLPAREPTDVGVRLVGQPDEVQQVRDPARLLRPGDAGDLEGVGDVAPHGATAQQVELLEDHPDAEPHAAQLALAQSGQLDAVDPHRARGDGLQGVDQPHERRLARAGVADDGIDVARLDVEVHAPDRLDRPGPATRRREGLVHVTQLHERPDDSSPRRGAALHPSLPVARHPRPGHGREAPSHTGCRDYWLSRVCFSTSASEATRSATGVLSRIAVLPETSCTPSVICLSSW